MNNKTFTTKNSILALMLLLLSQGVYAQTKEGNNWYFGQSGRMTWNQTQTIVNGGKTLTGLPTPIVGNTAMTNTSAGVFSISDLDGNLLFYSGGRTIWNRGHTPMQNGENLMPGVNDGSAQSGVAIPYPEQPGKYIALSLSPPKIYPSFPGDVLAYSIIDMTLAGGMGAVVEGEKSIRLTGYEGELGGSVSTVRHSNGVDFWIIAVGNDDGEYAYFNVWKVTQAGVDIECVASYSFRTNASRDSGGGYLRFSSDGKYFAWAENVISVDLWGDGTVYSPFIYFGEFNPSTGILSNIKVMDAGFTGYGLEFSPSGKILYMGNTGWPNTHIDAYRFEDLLAASDPISGSSVAHKTYPTTTHIGIGALQLGPDGRIYGIHSGASGPGHSAMSVIDNPDSFENATHHFLIGLMNGQGIGGLPNFMPHIFLPAPVAGVIGSNQTIYSGSTPAQLTSTEEASCKDAEGVFETITYLWEHSTDSITWTTAPSPNNLSTYQPPALTGTTYYRRSATSNTCGTVYSNVVKITVAPALSAGTIKDDQQILPNATPAPLTSVTAASGGIGTITYQWQSSTDGTTWTNIPGATGLGYAPGTLTTITHYRRVASDDNLSAESNGVTITVSASADMITITGAEASICPGDPITLSATASSVTNPVFRWYTTATGGTPLHTNATYAPSPNLTTIYHVSVSGDGLAESITRKAITVTVKPVSLPSMIKIQ